MLTNLIFFVTNFTFLLLFDNSCTHQRCHLSTYLPCLRMESRDHISPNSQTYFVRPLGKFLTRTPKRELVKWCQNWSPKSQKQHSIIECYDMWLSLSLSLLFQLWTRPGRVVWWWCERGELSELVMVAKAIFTWLMVSLMLLFCFSFLLWEEFPSTWAACLLRRCEGVGMPHIT